MVGQVSPPSPHGSTLQRRSFLRSSLGFAAAALPVGSQALAAPNNGPLGNALPNAMKTPGEADTPYGQPAGFERDVVRSESRAAGFSVWR